MGWCDPPPFEKILDPFMLLLTYPATSDPSFFTRSFKYPLRKSFLHINWNRQCHVFSYLCYKYHPPVLNIWNMPVQLKIKCNPNSGFNFVFKWKMLCCVCYLSFFAFYVLFVYLYHTNQCHYCNIFLKNLVSWKGISYNTFISHMTELKQSNENHMSDPLAYSLHNCLCSEYVTGSNI